MRKITGALAAAGLLAISLPILAGAARGGDTALAGEISDQRAIFARAAGPTDFSAARMGGAGGRSFTARPVTTRSVTTRSVATRTLRTQNVSKGLKVSRTVRTHKSGVVTGLKGTGTSSALKGLKAVGGAKGLKAGVGLIGPKGLKTVAPIKATNIAVINSKRINLFTSSRRIWIGGVWRSLIAIGLLTGYAIGPDFFYPEGYVVLAQPVCTGFTDDGCALRWQEVATEDGYGVPQCVEFCPRVRLTRAAQPVVRAVAVAPRQGCEVVVYQNKDLAGAPLRTTEDQPLLNDQWNKQIASIQVVAGTWDFSTEPQFGGDAMRLAPGAYRDLGTNWERQISSFMCAM